jgi:hypothetical protein
MQVALYDATADVFVFAYDGSLYVYRDVILSSQAARYVWFYEWYFWNALVRENILYDKPRAANTVLAIPIYPIVIASTSYLALLLTLPALRRVRRTRELKCLHCGYSLRALTSGRCPECGREFSDDELDKGAKWFHKPLTFSGVLHRALLRLYAAWYGSRKRNQTRFEIPRWLGRGYVAEPGVDLVVEIQRRQPTTLMSLKIGSLLAMTLFATAVPGIIFTSTHDALERLCKMLPVNDLAFIGIALIVPVTASIAVSFVVGAVMLTSVRIIAVSNGKDQASQPLNSWLSVF